MSHLRHVGKKPQHQESIVDYSAVLSYFSSFYEPTQSAVTYAQNAASRYVTVAQADQVLNGAVLKTELNGLGPLYADSSLGSSLSQLVRRTSDGALTVNPDDVPIGYFPAVYTSIISTQDETRPAVDFKSGSRTVLASANYSYWGPNTGRAEDVNNGQDYFIFGRVLVSVPTNAIVRIFFEIQYKDSGGAAGNKFEVAEAVSSVGDGKVQSLNFSPCDMAEVVALKDVSNLSIKVVGEFLRGSGTATLLEKGLARRILTLKRLISE